MSFEAETRMEETEGTVTGIRGGEYGGNGTSFNAEERRNRGHVFSRVRVAVMRAGRRSRYPRFLFSVPPCL
jgi:hypothetical protein